MLKVSPIRGVFQFEKNKKLSLRHTETSEILDRVGDVSYRLELPPSLSHVHNVFHISQLMKFIPKPSHVIDFGEIEVASNVTFEKQPFAIPGRRVKQLRNKAIRLVKAQWSRHGVSGDQGN